MGGIYEEHYLDELRCYDIHTKFHKQWLMQSKENEGRGGFTDCMEIA
jgi:hypothetical protein